MTREVQYDDLDPDEKRFLEVMRSLRPQLEWVAVSENERGVIRFHGVGDEAITLLPGWWRMKLSDIRGMPEATKCEKIL